MFIISRHLKRISSRMMDRIRDNFNDSPEAELSNGPEVTISIPKTKKTKRWLVYTVNDQHSLLNLSFLSSWQSFFPGLKADLHKALNVLTAWLLKVPVQHGTQMWSRTVFWHLPLHPTSLKCANTSNVTRQRASVLNTNQHLSYLNYKLGSQLQLWTLSLMPTEMWGIL